MRDVKGEMVGCERELRGRDVCGCNMDVSELGEEKRGGWDASAATEIENSEVGLVVCGKIWD